MMSKYWSSDQTDCLYLKAPRPWEKITTGHFSFDLNGASKKAGILKEPEINTRQTLFKAQSDRALYIF